MLRLVDDERYFVLHAPRQTGKTTVLLALRDKLNADGRYHCVYANFEVGQAAREDRHTGMRAILDELGDRAETTLGDGKLDELWPGILEKAGPDGALNRALRRWCAASSKPLVLLIDEIDALVGDTLLSVLRQLRAGYDQRPDNFPQSVVLCGLRDVARHYVAGRDYRIHSGAADRLVLGGSAFNIKSKSLRLGDFSAEELRSLFAQHTAETGQSFAEDAVRLVWEQTAGQPWLANALGRELCFAGETDRSRPIAARDVLQAQEALILRRDTHIDDLANKLAEERVRRVVEPILAGASTQSWATEDLAYARDLGLVAQDIGGTPRIANPIYAEVVPRHLTYQVEAGLPQQPARYVRANGELDIDALMAAFQGFFRENSEHWVQRFDQYHEAGPQLLLQAYLQRIVNGGGRIEREYARWEAAEWTC